MADTLPLNDPSTSPDDAAEDRQKMSPAEQAQRDIQQQAFINQAQAKKKKLDEEDYKHITGILSQMTLYGVLVNQGKDEKDPYVLVTLRDAEGSKTGELKITNSGIHISAPPEDAEIKAAMDYMRRDPKWGRSCMVDLKLFDKKALYEIWKESIKAPPVTIANLPEKMLADFERWNKADLEPEPAPEHEKPDLPPDDEDAAAEGAVEEAPKKKRFNSQSSERRTIYVSNTRKSGSARIRVLQKNKDSARVGSKQEDLEKHLAEGKSQAGWHATATLDSSIQPHRPTSVEPKSFLESFPPYGLRTLQPKP